MTLRQNILAKLMRHTLKYAATHLAVGCLMAYAGFCCAATFVVNSTDDTPDINPGDGVAQDSLGRTTLRAAIMESNALPGAHEILLSSGTYKISTFEPATPDPENRGDLNVTGDVSVVGLGSAETIIDANGETGFAVGPGAQLELHQLALKNAYQDLFQGEGESSGVANDHGELWVDGCIISECNYALKNEYGTAHVTECALNLNYARWGGSAIFNSHGIIELADTTCRYNRGYDSPISGLNAAMAIVSFGDESRLVIKGSKFRLNDKSPSRRSDVIVQAGGTAELSNVEFYGNVGGVACYGGTVSIDSSSLYGCPVTMNGLSNKEWTADSADLSMHRSVASDSILSFNKSSADISNCLVEGELHLDQEASASIDFSTFINARSSYTLEAIVVNPSNNLVLRNSIITSNNNTTSTVGSIRGSITSHGHNIITPSVGGTGFDPSDLLDVDPKMYTATIGQVVLLPGSAAIDAADPSAPVSDTDYIGVHRPRDGNGDGLALPDIGASEFLPTTVGRAAGDFDGSGCTDLGDFLIVLDNWQGSFDGQPIVLQDFLNVLDYWSTGAGCG